MTCRLAPRDPVPRRHTASGAARGGSTLLEVVVALPLALLLSALAINLFVTQLRTTQHVGQRVTNTRELEQAVGMLAADLRHAAATDIEEVTDSSLILSAPVLTAIVCDAPAPHLIDVLSGTEGHPLQLAQFTTVRAGDRVVTGPMDSTLTGLPLRTLDSLRHITTLRDMHPRPGACADSPLQRTAGGTPWRLTLATPLGEPPERGSSIAVSRRTEWRAYHAADNAWYLGRRDWNGGAWTTIQPAMGPLLRNRDGGFQPRLERADGSPVAAPDPDARVLALQLRMPRPGAVSVPPLYDSLHARVTLRRGR